jgi:hypothetical protein
MGSRSAMNLQSLAILTGEEKQKLCVPSQPAKKFAGRTENRKMWINYSEKEIAS